MIKRCLSACCLFFIITITTLQNAKCQNDTLQNNNTVSQTNLEWRSNSYLSGDKALRKFEIIGSDENYLYAYHPASDEIGSEEPLKTESMYRYNLQTGEYNELKFELGFWRGRNIEFVAMHNKKVYVFSSFKDVLKRKFILYAQTVNLENFTLNSELNPVLEIAYNGDGGRNKIAKFECKSSPDASKLLLSYQLIDNDKTVRRYGFAVLDNNAKLVWQQSNVRPANTTWKWLILKEYAVDNAGNVYLLGNLYEKERYANKEGYANKTIVMAFSQQSQVETIAVNLSEGYYAQTANIDINNNSELVCAGIYSQNKMTSALGIFSLVCNPFKNKVNDQKAIETPFSDELLIKGLTEKAGKKLLERKEKRKDFEEWSYRAEDLTFKTDGSFQMIVEKTNKETKVIRETNDYPVTKTKYTYGDILVTDFAKDGSANWSQKIVKSQKLNAKNFKAGSYGFIYDKNENVHFFYNLMGKSGKDVNDSHFMVTTFDKNGKETTKDLHDSDQNDVVINPNELLKNIKTGEIYLFGKNGSKKPSVKVLNLQ